MMSIHKFLKKFLITGIYLTFFRFPTFASWIPNGSEVENNFNLINQSYLKTIPENFYIIGPGDALQIIISQDYPELNTFAQVTGEGTINIPKLNKIYVQGLTVNELINLLNDAYKEFALSFCRNSNQKISCTENLG